MSVNVDCRFAGLSFHKAHIRYVGEEEVNSNLLLLTPLNLFALLQIVF